MAMLPYVVYNGMEIYIGSLFKGYVLVKVTSMKTRGHTANRLQ
ncbi:protein of unknown function [Thermococcus camini]|uniref:Uncharacterized protein n=1 Tax=Thermococcus camini TaxID=2016373 RepID=A0A7G2D492_9EURY|nr:protein of unknown function [Thermococcus camini]